MEMPGEKMAPLFHWLNYFRMASIYGKLKDVDSRLRWQNTEQKNAALFQCTQMCIQGCSQCDWEKQESVRRIFPQNKNAKGNQCAVTATACKLAVIIYKMLTSAEKFREVKAVV